MIRTAELYVTVEQGSQLVSELAGTITLGDDGRFVVKANWGHEALMQNAMRAYHVVGDRAVYREKDPVGWFDSLPSHYSSPYGAAVIRQT